MAPGRTAHTRTALARTENLRIVGGDLRGRTLAAPTGRNTRPTADRVREAVFNVLLHNDDPLEGAAVLDAFAGSGALGFEALSRGAASVTFIENDETALAVIAANARKLGVQDKITLLRADALKPPKARAPAALVMLDPPYGGGLAPVAITALATAGWIAPEAVVVAEVAGGERLDPPPVGFTLRMDRRYGAARVVFLERSPATK